MNMDGPQNLGTRRTGRKTKHQVLSSAYRQLRETVSDFRFEGSDTPAWRPPTAPDRGTIFGTMAKPSNLGLQAARTNAFAPNEEITPFQVCARSTGQRGKHQQAEAACGVNVSARSPQVKAKIRATGAGLPDSGPPENIYGRSLCKTRPAHWAASNASLIIR